MSVAHDLETRVYWNPAWETPQQRELATAVLDQRNAAHLATLAGACEAAGCTSQKLLADLRDPNRDPKSHAWLLGRLSGRGSGAAYNRFREGPAPAGKLQGTSLRAVGVFDWWEERLGLIVEPVAFSNIACTAGLNLMLEDMFRSGAQSASWYAGIIDSTGYVGVLAADTSASHTGWAEFTSYSSATRPQWSPAAASGGIVVNTTAFTYTLTADMTAKGIFIINSNTKGGTTGTLFSTGLNDRSATNGTVLSATYTVTLTPS